MNPGNVMAGVLLVVFGLVAAATKPTCSAGERAVLPRGSWWICARAP